MTWNLYIPDGIRTLCFLIQHIYTFKKLFVYEKWIDKSI